MINGGEAGETEKDLAGNILPLPIDQRYDEQDMRCMADKVLICIEQEKGAI